MLRRKAVFILHSKFQAILFIHSLRFKMSTIENVSLFIPHVFPNFTKEYVTEAFKHYGKVNHVDFVAKIDRNGAPFNSAYVHFDYWFDTCDNYLFQRRLFNPDQEARVYHDNPWYWVVLENKSKKHVSGGRKPCIDLGSASVISVSTPAKPILRRECPGAPVKDQAYSLFVSWPEGQRQLWQDDDDVCPIEAPLSIGPNDYPDLLSDYGADEMLDQMDEIDAELEAEDAALVTIDGRYVQEIERENMLWREEVGKLRAVIASLCGAQVSNLNA